MLPIEVLKNWLRLLCDAEGDGFVVVESVRVRNNLLKLIKNNIVMKLLSYLFLKIKMIRMFLIKF